MIGPVCKVCKDPIFKLANSNPISTEHDKLCRVQFSSKSNPSCHTHITDVIACYVGVTVGVGT